MKSRPCLCQRRGWLARLARFAALLAVAAVLSGCGERTGVQQTLRPDPGRSAAPSAVARDGLLESERNTIEVFGRTKASVVFVANAALRRSPFSFNQAEVPRGAGSGFVWDEAGHVVTNYHVIYGGDRFTVSLADGATFEAELIGVAPRKDLAVLRIRADRPLQPVELGDSEHLRVGQKVLAIGNPFGLDSSLTTGVISALGREIESVAGTRIEDVIQTDASINPGNSGGPLLDSSGRVIGVTTAIYSTSGSSSGIGFAVPATTLARIVPQLIEHGRVKWAGLGVTVMPDHIAAQWGVIGVIVRDVFPDSAAQRAGLRPVQLDRLGNVRSVDVITHVQGRVVVKLVDLIDVLDDYEPGDTVNVRYERDDTSTEIRVELGELR